MKIDPNWAKYATPRQAQAVETMAKAENISAAARTMGVDRNSLKEMIKRAELAATRAGYAPESDYTHPAPVGFHTKGVSTLYGANGEVKQQWVKSRADDTYRDEILREAALELAAQVKPLPRVTGPKTVNEDLLVAYPIGDPHWGMFAWPEETGGEAWDIQIAEDTFRTYLEEIVSRSPPAKKALLVDLGDSFHTDNSTNRTNASGHALDVDTRWAKIFKIGTRIMRHFIDLLLTKHQEVEVWVVRGNHDDHSAFTLACVLDALYSKNPRVNVRTEWTKFHFMEWESCLFMASHGDTCKRDKLREVMTCYEGGAPWGRTSERRIWSGHIHHQTVLEYPGCVSETFNTMAPADSWHAGQGYSAKRDVKSQIFHKTHGLIGTNVCRVLPKFSAI